MEHTILVGDHVLINKLLYGARLPFTSLRLPAVRQVQRGDIVSVRAPRSELLLIKRVIALGGDRVVIRGGVLYVNGQLVREPYAIVSPGMQQPALELVVPGNSVFLLGDNRDLSEDSRAFGAVPLSNIRGEPLFVCWSFANTWQEWLDEKGAIRPQAYFAVLRNPIAKVRWWRFGRRL